MRWLDKLILRDDFSLSDAWKRKDEAKEDGKKCDQPHVVVSPFFSDVGSCILPVKAVGLS